MTLFWCQFFEVIFQRSYDCAHTTLCCGSDNVFHWKFAGGQWEKEDCDVSNERKRIEGGASGKDTVVINRLHKTYCGQGLDMEKVAVKDLSLGIPPGQCFGFL